MQGNRRGSASFREKAIADYESERDSRRRGEYFSCRRRSAAGSWDVDTYWRARSTASAPSPVNTKDLIVQDLKSVEHPEVPADRNRGRAASSS